jgi:hypothetical protein
VESRFVRVFGLFMPVFVFAFLATDYIWTGSVTNTWIGISIIAATIVGFVKLILPPYRAVE